MSSQQVSSTSSATIDNVYSILNSLSKNGDVETIKLLLMNKGVDPSFNGNEALFLALKNDHLEVAKLLCGCVGMDVKAALEAFRGKMTQLLSEELKKCNTHI